MIPKEGREEGSALTGRRNGGVDQSGGRAISPKWQEGGEGKEGRKVTNLRNAGEREES